MGRLSTCIQFSFPLGLLLERRKGQKEGTKSSLANTGGRGGDYQITEIQCTKR